MRTPIEPLVSAPLAYVLAEVRFAAVFDLARRAQEMHDAIRERFPRAETIAQVSFLAGSSNGALGQAQFYCFTDRERTAAVVLSESGISYSVTHYEAFQAFREDFSWLLGRLKGVVGLDLVARCGLRYIDVIVLGDGESLFDYVGGAVKELVRGEQPRTQMLVEFPRPNGALAVRFMALNAPVYMSPDVLSLNLVPPAWLHDAQQTGLNTGILDMDCWTGADDVFDGDALLETFTALHADLKAKFEDIATAHALDVWREPRPETPLVLEHSRA